MYHLLVGAAGLSDSLQLQATKQGLQATKQGLQATKQGLQAITQGLQATCVRREITPQQ